MTNIHSVAALIVAAKNLCQYWDDVERYLEMDATAMTSRAAEMRKRDAAIKQEVRTAIANILEQQP